MMAKMARGCVGPVGAALREPLVAAGSSSEVVTSTREPGVEISEQALS
jgi:hypothetical protein